MTCRDCKYADWQRTPTGRIKYAAGNCTYPIPELPPMPVSVRFEMTRRFKIWPDGGENCPVWEKDA